LEPKLRKEAKRIKVTWGPYALPPADVSNYLSLVNGHLNLI
jgi:hypothetical protein